MVFFGGTLRDSESYVDIIYILIRLISDWLAFASLQLYAVILFLSFIQHQTLEFYHGISNGTLNPPPMNPESLHVKTGCGRQPPKIQHPKESKTTRDFRSITHTKAENSITPTTYNTNP